MHPTSRLNLTRPVPLGALLACSLLVAADPPEPEVVNPGPPGGPPSDAIVLFDGKDLARWRGERGAARWTLVDGVMEVNGTGSLLTKDEFGDCQLHVEGASPVAVQGDGQGRGNSGVYLQGRYETP